MRCTENPSMECPTPRDCWVGEKVINKIYKYLVTTLLKSTNFEPITSHSSDFANAKQSAMCERADISLCVSDDATMMIYFDTGRVNRRVCATFKAAVGEYKRRNGEQHKRELWRG